MPLCRSFFVEHDRDAVRPVLADDLQQHGREAVHRVGLQAFGVTQRGQGEECAIDVGAAVDQVEGFALFF